MWKMMSIEASTITNWMTVLRMIAPVTRSKRRVSTSGDRVPVRVSSWTAVSVARRVVPRTQTIEVKKMSSSSTIQMTVLRPMRPERSARKMNSSVTKPSTAQLMSMR